MSTGNVEIARRALEALNTGDLDAAAEFLDPDIEWRMHPTIPEAGTFQGIVEVRHRLQEFLDSWDEFSVEIEEMIDVGDDRVVVLARFSGRSKELGLPLSGAGTDAQIVTLRDGRVTRVWMYAGTREALESVGLPQRASSS